MDWLSVILRIIEGFLGWKKADTELELETVDDRRKADAEARRKRSADAAEDHIKKMAEALARAKQARKENRWDEAREAMAEVERLQRERDRANTPIGV